MPTCASPSSNTFRSLRSENVNVSLWRIWHWWTNWTLFTHNWDKHPYWSRSVYVFYGSSFEAIKWKAKLAKAAALKQWKQIKKTLSLDLPWCGMFSLCMEWPLLPSPSISPPRWFAQLWLCLLSQWGRVLKQAERALNRYCNWHVWKYFVTLHFPNNKNDNLISPTLPRSGHRRGKGFQPAKTHCQPAF